MWTRRATLHCDISRFSITLDQKRKTNFSWPLTLIMQKRDHFRLLRHRYSESPVIPLSNDIWYRCVAHGFITFYFLIFYRWSNVIENLEISQCSVARRVHICRKSRKWSRFCIIKVKGQEKFVFRFRLSFEKCIFLKNEIQFDKFDGFYLMDHILN
jgi:hypothetical protein